MVQVIQPQLLRDWKKEGEIIAIWRCDRCFRKIPLYKTNNPLINSIYLSFASFEKYCSLCQNKENPRRDLKKKIRREVILLKKYENVIVELDEEDIEL